MHISLCFRSTSKENEIQAKQRRGGTPAKDPPPPPPPTLKEIKQSNRPV